MIQLATVSITASDTSQQRKRSLNDIPVDLSVGEVIDQLVRHIDGDGFVQDGQPIQVEARLEREGRYLHRSERVGDALRPNDHVTLHPKIMAGGTANTASAS